MYLFNDTATSWDYIVSASQLPLNLWAKKLAAMTNRMCNCCCLFSCLAASWTIEPVASATSSLFTNNRILSDLILVGAAWLLNSVLGTSCVAHLRFCHVFERTAMRVCLFSGRSVQGALASHWVAFVGFHVAGKTAFLLRILCSSFLRISSCFIRETSERIWIKFHMEVYIENCLENLISVYNLWSVWSADWYIGWCLTSTFYRWHLLVWPVRNKI